MHFKRARAGFTLIELIVVMAIMGILIAATASTFQNSRIKGKDAKRKSDLKQIQSALEAYIGDHGLYPVSTAGVITACGDGTAVCSWGSAFKDENGTVYMAKVPIDSDYPTFSYEYFVSSDRKQYQLFAYLEDSNDPDLHTYTGKNCPDANHVCNYGISSTNTTPTATLP
ncbi:hypothetical protein C5B42_05045 [Candidatus Cerribacteria bacterium 'Amazon FNV 2010 28 9']|uniref:Type II secretion system protein GspG C-terminal domain-containing protein n=1 Tax=Candidatus Cerribacteria bacterium 'Amazon FNV 2010 28 9' TaxID=2081795 RepID=A0A317JN39_9BACT|nr:MAG: hypothetical protein C5B42_05045 [Candidatus Cerribacteria bacterium 'Amazon FNV 2010 28 9']